MLQTRAAKRTAEAAVKVACESADIRIRLGSLEPESMDIDTLRLLASYKNFCPQFHLSLQSGCDATLRRMNRHYTTAEYAGIVQNIRSVFENPAITTDVMVGFAGETEQEFNTSMNFVESMGFAKVHIFPYSRRAGTVADKAPDQVSPEIKKQRAALMAEAAQRSTSSFLESQVGRTEQVLIETRNKNGLYEGYTKNYTPVLVKTDDTSIGKILSVKLTSSLSHCCCGNIESDPPICTATTE